MTHFFYALSRYANMSKMVKHTAIIILLSALALKVNADPLIQRIYGEAGSFLFDTLESAKAGEIEQLTKALSSAYLEDSSNGDLLSELNSVDWQMKEFVILSVYKFENTQCFVVQFEIEMNEHGPAQNQKSTVPVFVQRERGEWKLWNFPFAPVVAYNYPTRELCLNEPTSQP